MFNSNTYLKIEFLPDGRPVFTSRFNKKTNAAVVADFINSFITRQDLQEWLENIYEVCKSKGIEDIGEEICERVLIYQNGVQVRPAPRSGRNPIIKPSQVMKQFIHGGNDD